MYKNFNSLISPIIITTHNFDTNKLLTKKMLQKEKEKQQWAYIQLQKMGFEL